MHMQQRAVFVLSSVTPNALSHTGPNIDAYLRGTTEQVLFHSSIFVDLEI